MNANNKNENGRKPIYLRREIFPQFFNAELFPFSIESSSLFASLRCSSIKYLTETFQHIHSTIGVISLQRLRMAFASSLFENFF
jgi:hypothetical protein